MLNLRKKKKVVSKSDMIFSVFEGEFVNITTRVNITDAITTPEGTVSQAHPLTVSGYLKEMDDHYYYIGEEPNSIHAAIAIKDVVLIQEVKMPDAYDAMLDGADMRKMN